VRIGIDYTAAVNQSAGIGRFVRALVGGLAELDQDNQYLLLHAANRTGLNGRLPRARNFVARSAGLPQRYLDIIWHRMTLPLPVNLMLGRLDLFHSPDFVLPPVSKAVSVLTVHDLAFLLQPECAEANLRAYLEKAVPRSARRADYIVADSEHTRNDVICLLGVPPEKVAVVPGGVESTFQPVEDLAQLAALRERLGIGQAPFILSVGLIEPRKNLPVLFDAYRLLRERKGLPHLLVVAGNRGWLSAGTIEHAERSPYRDDIRFVGYVAEEALPGLYTAASAFAFPSLYEGFGLPPLEAMACGTPTVVSRASSLPEVAGEAALQVDPRDVDGLAAALELLLLDDVLRAELRTRGIQRARAFSWRAAARKQLDVYERLAG
jgi:glycosyltransferase involved in cell wall biosynthesis